MKRGLRRWSMEWVRPALLWPRAPPPGAQMSIATAPNNSDPAPASQRASVSKQDPRLRCDLRQHWRAHLSLASRTPDKVPELGNSRLMVENPLLDCGIDLRTSATGKEVDPQLLEVSPETGDQQTLPLILRHEARDFLL